MRHKSGLRKLNRTTSSRKALFRNMSVSLIEEEAIKTTLPKAKELRRVIEGLITLSKRNDTVSGRRLAFARLGSRSAVTKLFNDLRARFVNRPGGYVRLLKMGFRKGDNAPLAYIEFVERGEVSVAKQQTREVAEAVEE